MKQWESSTWDNWQPKLNGDEPKYDDDDDDGDDDDNDDDDDDDWVWQVW